MTRRKAPRPSSKREGALLLELQRDYGYALCNLSRPADRIGMMFSAPKWLAAVRYVKLAVPFDSALGKALIAADKKQPKTRRARKDKP